MKTPLLALLLCSLLLAACGKETTDSGATTRIEGILALTGDSTNGGTLFAASCASCHGDDGKTGTASNLAAVVPDLPDQELVNTIISGKGSMPAQDLEDQDTADILAWLRATFT